MKLSGLLLVLLVAVSLLIQVPAEAKRRGDDRGRNRDRDRNERVENYSTTPATNDADLIRAVNDRRNVRFLSAAGLTVSRLMEDDSVGRPHQRWFVRLSNGQEVFCVYNLDMGGRVPLRVGDVIFMAGEFKWTDRGALLHWLHHDPSNRRPDGYVEVGGNRYGLK